MIMRHTLCGAFIYSIIRPKTLESKLLMYKKSIFVLVMYLGLVIFLLSTRPVNLPVGALLVPVIWFFLAMFNTVLLAFDLAVRPRQRLSFLKKRYAVAALGAGAPTLLLILNSISQLTARDVLIVLVFTIATLFYLQRIKFGQ